VDADSFASLCLLNRQWYGESQKLDLYAHHLSRCPSFALTNNVITGPFRRNDLFRLKTKFAAEVRRNLFAAYLRPRETVVNIISINASSSTAFPGGEAFRFSFSPSGQTLLALSSSRIFVIGVTADPIVVHRELKTLRRPLAASVTDDGSLLAVLSTKHQANIYGLVETDVKHLQVIVLDNPPRTIALAHEGTVLAAAYETGVEVFSLAANALSTDRRAVRCEAVDSLTFSGDGSMLVGSSQSLEDPSTVVISAPFYAENDPDLTPRELHSRQWTTQILFPNNSASISHAALIPSHAEGDANWLFAFDHMLNTYRAVRTDDTRTGVAYFLSPSLSRRFSVPFPSNPPSTTACGDLVVAGFHGLGLWLYGIPERLDVSPDMGSVVERHESRIHGRMALTSATGNPEPLMAYSPSVTGSSESIEDDSLAGKVDWRQSLFVKCKQLKSINGSTEARWVERPESRPTGFLGKRLVVVAPGGVSGLGEDMGDDQSMPVDGGRLLLLDFDYAPSTKANQELTIEVGLIEPQLLQEQHGNLDIEVALERRRTVRGASGRGHAALARSVTAMAPSTGMQTFLERQYQRGSTSQPSSPCENAAVGQDIGSPFMPSQPRAPDTIHRVATSAGLYRSRFPPRPPLGTPQDPNSRPNGRRDSNDSWESPPPPYSSSPSAPAAARGYPGWPNPNPSPLATPLPSPMNPSASTSGPAINHSPHPAVHMPFPPSIRHQTAGSLPSLPYSANMLPAPLRFTEPVSPATEPFQNPPLATTSFESPAIPVNPLSRLGFQPAVPRSSRSKGYSDTSLSTVTELNNFHQAMNGVQFSPPQSASAISSPASTEPSYFPRRRPVSHDSSNGFSSIPQTLSATVSRPLSPPMPEPDPQIMTHAGSDNVSTSATQDDALSQSGANLQNLPSLPTPIPTRKELQKDIRPNLPAGPPSAPTRLPPNGNAKPLPPVPPTADQMAQLNRRVSQTRPRPPVVLTNGGASDNSSATQDFGRVPSSPPRAAWGAAGVPGSPSFSRAIHTPQGLTRADPRSSPRSVSASAPDLSAQRPRYGRLDTIESVANAYANTEQVRRPSDSLVQNMIAPPHADPADPDGWTSAPDSKVDKKRKRKQKIQDDHVDSSAADGGKKGSRCSIM
jgi:hypothetical protein